MSPSTLEAFAQRATRRHGRTHLAARLQAGLLAGLATATAVLFLTSLLGRLDLGIPAVATRAWGLGGAGSAVVVGVVVGAVLGALARKTRVRVVVAVDRDLGLRSQLAGGYALAERGEAGGLPRLAVERAERTAAAIDLRQALPSPRRDVLLVLFLIAASGLALDPHSPSSVAQAEAVATDLSAAKAASRVAERLRAAAAGLEAGAEALSDPQRKAALERAESLEHAARALEFGGQAGTASERVTRSALAKATAGLASAGQEAEGLSRAGEALQRSALGRRLGEAMVHRRTTSLPEIADRLAADLRGGVAPDAQDELAKAAESAAQAAARTPGVRDALESLSQALAATPPGEPSEEAASAAAGVARAAQDPLQTALLERLTADASAVARQAWKDLAGGGAGESSGTADPGAQAKASSGGGDEGQARPGSGGKPDAQAKRAAGGGARAGSATSGAPARGASGGAAVAGRGDAKAEVGGAPSAERQGRTARLRGHVGRHGRAVTVALEELRRGAPSERARELVTRYGQVEEEALRRDAVPPERRRLVRDYLRAIRGGP